MKESDVILSHFSQLGRAIRARMSRICPLPFSQCELVGFVSEHDSPTMRDIARHFNITAPSATSLVEVLVREKMIVREQDARDRRTVRVRLTPAGKRTAALLSKRKAKVLGGIIRKLEPHERHDLERILRHITSDL